MPTYWDIKKWIKQKESRIKRLKTLLHHAELELTNLIIAEQKAEAIEEAELINRGVI
jgi:succinate dehydrogenase flavin-adding protein (antitoxin of CptAB toxin-antitoxin module)